MKILVVDDDMAYAKAIMKMLTSFGHVVRTSYSAFEAIAQVKKEVPDILLVDIKMPEVDGLEFIKMIRQEFIQQREPVIIVQTGYADLESAIASLREGVFDYLRKPIGINELKSTLERCKSKIELQKSYDAMMSVNNNSMKQHHSALIKIANVPFIAASQARKELYRRAISYHKVKDIPVLIEGETGTGKELVATLIHYGEEEANNEPFVALNCAAIPHHLCESELFGYEHGAFTGAIKGGAKGKFELASGGTLFMDEIGEMHYEMQAKLLRVIQERTFYRIGGTLPVKFSGRLLCATNRNLMELCKTGKFRDDLFYRLNAAHLLVPPLRECLEDIKALAVYFLQHSSNKRMKHFRMIADSTFDLLYSYHWPGNVRELQNLIDRAVLEYDGELLLPEHLSFYKYLFKREAFSFYTSSETTVPSAITQEDQTASATPLYDLERQHILDALKKSSFNISRAAKFLKISRPVLYRRLAKYKITLPKKDE